MSLRVSWVISAWLGLIELVMITMSVWDVAQDGSCNVLQHYAALGRDVVGAESVNLTPVDAPKDVYSDVLALVCISTVLFFVFTHTSSWSYSERRLWIGTSPKVLLRYSGWRSVTVSGTNSTSLLKKGAVQTVLLFVFLCLLAFNWMALWKNRTSRFFPPITQSCPISDVLFTGGRGVSDFCVLKY